MSIRLKAYSDGIVLRMSVDPNGKPAVTDYEVIEQFERAALVRFRPHTGRMHQIRLHASHIRHPLLWDYVYGLAQPECAEVVPKEILGRYALHAAEISFVHPSTKKVCMP